MSTKHVAYGCAISDLLIFVCVSVLLHRTKYPDVVKALSAEQTRLVSSATGQSADSKTAPTADGRIGLAFSMTALPVDKVLVPAGDYDSVLRPLFKRFAVPITEAGDACLTVDGAWSLLKGKTAAADL